MAESALVAPAGDFAGGSALDLVSLSKSYVAGKPVLKEITLSIADRGITAIIGPSGTGKSTLVRCINRLVSGSRKSLSATIRTS